MTSEIRVLIADDSFVVRSGLRNFVGSLPEMRVVGEAASGREAISVATETTPDVVLMDLRMRDGDGIAATREIGAAVPSARTIIVSWSDEPEHVRDAYAAGARGYLVHGRFGASQLASALRAVAKGTDLLGPAVEKPTAAPHGAAPTEARLTGREAEILALVRRGRRNREIAAQLGIEEKTVKNHLNSIYSKLDLSGRIEAMAGPPLAEDEPL
jgi:DNA-binding NarL/FixJ family response regulator